MKTIAFIRVAGIGPMISACQFPMNRKIFLRIVLIAVLLMILPGARRSAVSAADGDTEPYTFRMTQSTSAYVFWTTPPSERVFKDSAVPTAAGGEVKVYAAKNEFEPFQVVVRPASSGNVTVSVGNFGAGISTEIYQVKYVNIVETSDSLGRTGPYPDPLWPIANNASAPVTAGQNTAFWFSISVSASAAAGDYTTNVIIGGVAIPVRLHVFNFAIPDELHVASQMNFNHQAVLNAYSVPGTGSEYWMYVDKMKQFFIDHRLTPSSVLWSGGLTSGGSFARPYIAYDCGTHSFSDHDGIWGFEDPAERYLGGTGLMAGQFSTLFNGGTGFSTFMAAGFQNNDPAVDQRPSPFCGLTRTSSDWLNNPNSAYNQAWFTYVTAMRNYLASLGYLDEAYHYFANEPQDQTDYNAVAWYSRYSHQAAPDLKLMVSEEPKPEIYDQPGAHIDIWLPVLNNYDPVVSHDRERYHGEETWIYFLHGTRPPYFNPITLDHPGIESKLTGWFLWKYRVRGIAYYSMNDWSDNPWQHPMTDGHNGDTFMLYPPSEANTPISYGSNGHRMVPSIRFELMRDSLEDYEYLYLLGGGQPAVGAANAADPQADKIIYGLTGYSRNSEFMYNLRRLIGLKNGGEISVIPDITPEPDHERSKGAPGNYYINFQNPAGEPTANPLVVGGKTYLKIGGGDYSLSNGYGWFSPPDANWMTAYTSSGPNVLQRSILYSDWGRPATFEFDLPNGDYVVTLSVGWFGRTYGHQKAVIEGVTFVNDEATTPTTPYLVRTQPVKVKDYKLSLSIGIFDEYTMLNYLNIEAANPPVTNLRISDASVGGGSLTAHLKWTRSMGAQTTSIRYSTSPITAATWDSATSLTDSLSGSAETFTAFVPYTGGTVYFALKSQNGEGVWSPVSNNAFYPWYDTYLSLVRR